MSTRGPLPRTRSCPAAQSMSSSRRSATSLARSPRRTNSVRIAKSRIPTRVVWSHPFSSRSTCSPGRARASSCWWRATVGTAEATARSTNPAVYKNRSSAFMPPTTVCIAATLNWGLRAKTNAMTSAPLSSARLDSIGADRPARNCRAHVPVIGGGGVAQPALVHQVQTEATHELIDRRRRRGKPRVQPELLQVLQQRCQAVHRQLGQATRSPPRLKVLIENRWRQVRQLQPGGAQPAIQMGEQRALPAQAAGHVAESRSRATKPSANGANGPDIDSLQSFVEPKAGPESSELMSRSAGNSP